MIGVIQAVQEPQTTLASNTASIPFSITDLRTRSAINCRGWMNHNEGSPLFSILEGGLYEISFNANVTSEPGQVALALFADGTEVPGTETDATIATAGEYSNVAFNKAIRVCCKGTVNLSVNSLPTITYNDTITDTQTPIVKNARIYIERIA